MAHCNNWRWSISPWAALLAVLLASCTGQVLSATQQEGPNASPGTCFPPASLDSFQGKQITTSVGSTCTALAYSDLIVSYSSQILLQYGDLLVCLAAQGQSFRFSPQLRPVQELTIVAAR